MEYTMRSARVVFAFLLLSSAAAAQQYVISTFAGGGAPATSSVAVDAAIGTPFGVATDAAGNVYFASSDLNSVFKLRQNGVLTRVAGNSSWSQALISERPGPKYSGDGGPATSARLNSPGGVAVDERGQPVHRGRGNHRIRRVSPDGIITTVAGNGMAPRLASPEMAGQPPARN